MTVYDRKTGQSMDFEDNDQLNDAIKSGQYGFKPGQKITVYNKDDPDDVYTMPADNFKKAYDNGYRMETKFKTAVRHHVDDNKGFIGGTKVFAGELANSALFGVPEILMRNTMNPLDWAKVNGLRDEHELAGMAGMGLGIGLNVYGLARTGALKATEKISEAAVNVMAKRISASVGGKISTTAARNSARDILTRTANTISKTGAVVARNTAKGAIEGTIDMSVPAAAEAAFGNYEEAAESLLIGSAFGGILGGGIGSALDGFAAGAKRSKQLLETGPGDQGNILQEKALDLTASGMNMNKDNLKYIINNSDEVRNATPFAKKYDEIQAKVGQFQSEFDEAKHLVDRDKNEMATLFNEKKLEADRVANNPDQAVSDKLTDLISFAKKKSGELSEMGDDALIGAFPARSINKQMVVDQADELIAKYGSRQSAKYRQAVGELERIKKNVQASEFTDFDGPGLREFMRDTRDNINYDRNMASYDDGMNEVFKKYTRNISEYLKKESTPYREIMEEAAPIQKALDEMGKVVNDPTRRLDFSRVISKTKKTAGDQIASDRFYALVGTLTKYDEFADVGTKFEDLFQLKRSANDFLGAKKLVDADKTGKALDNFQKANFPEKYDVMQANKAKYAKLQGEAESFKPLMSGDLEQRLRKLAKEKGNIELTRSFEALSKKYNLGNLERDVKNTVYNENLTNARVNGSRLVNWGGATGAGMGGVFGLLTPFDAGLTSMLAMVAGATSGAMLDRYGGKLVKGSLEPGTMASKFRGLLVTEQKMKKVALEIDSVTASLKELPKKDKLSKAKVFRTTASRLLDEIIRSERAEKRTTEDKRKAKEAGPKPTRQETTEVKAWRVLTDKFVEMESNPNMAEELAQITGELATQGGPNIAEVLTAKVVKGMSYLSKEIPKDPNPPNKFVKTAPFTPSDYDVKKFTDKVVVVKDPMIVFQALAAGELSKDHVEALKEIYPSLYQRVVEKVTDTLINDEIELDYGDRVGLSYILGAPLDPSMSTKSFAYFQPQRQEQAGPEQGPPPDKIFKPKINMNTGSYETVSQRIGARS